MLRVGDDVVIEFENFDHVAVIERIENDWCFATMAIDPELDYGSATARLAPYQTVCVHLSSVRYPD